MTGYLSGCIAHPAFEVGYERADLVLPGSASPFVRQTIDGALEIEDRIDESHRLDRQRRFRAATWTPAYTTNNVIILLFMKYVTDRYGDGSYSNRGSHGRRVSTR